MKAIVCTRFGSPDVLRLQEVPQPVPADNQVLIKIHAASVLLADCQFRGLKLPLAFRLPVWLYFGHIRKEPFILGQELAGEIAAVGPAVTRFKQGERVCAWRGFALGTHAEYACISQDRLLTLLPAAMSYAEAATIPVGGLEATYFLKKAGIQRGQKVLIIGAGGSIGSFAIQLARHLGAHVTAVDSTVKLDFMRSLGADRVIDYTQENYTRRGDVYDVILDVIGKSSYSRSLKMLRPAGRYLVANPHASHRILYRLTPKSAKQVILWTSRPTQESLDDLAFLRDLIEAGQVISALDRCYPLEQAADAHRYVESGQKKGHVVLTMGE